MNRSFALTSTRSLSPRGPGARGAVYVESILVLSLLVLAFAGVIYFHDLYAAKIATLYKARNHAWSSAMPGCRGGALAVLGPAALASNLLSNAPNATPSQQHPGLLQLGAPQIESVAETVQAPALLGAFSSPVSTSTRFVCNELPQEHRDLVSLVSYVKDLFIP